MLKCIISIGTYRTELWPMRRCYSPCYDQCQDDEQVFIELVSYHPYFKVAYSAGYRSVLMCGLCIGFSACSNAPSTAGSEDFFAKVEQSADVRVVVSTLAAVDSINLSDYGVFNAGSVEVDEQWIYLADRQLRKIVAIAKKDRGSNRFIGHGPGEGPGEVVSSGGFGVSSQHLFWKSKPARIARFSIAGTFIDEIELDHNPWLLEVTKDNRLVTFDPMSDDYLFVLMSADGTVVRKIGRVHDAEEVSVMSRSLRYAGYVDYHNDHIYYAGYSESLIKKYTLDGTLVFSVSTIDNHPSEINYVETVGGTSIMAGYAPAALFASLNVVVHGNYCFIHPATDDDHVRLRYLDIYSASTGEYLESYSVRQPPEKFTVDDDYIYVIQTHRDPETGERDFYVKFYDNMLRDR